MIKLSVCFEIRKQNKMDFGKLNLYSSTTKNIQILWNNNYIS